jgi:hypothetical protein
MNDGELEQRYAALGVQPGVTLEELERAYLKKNFSLLKGRTGSATEANPELDAERRALRDNYDRLVDHIRLSQRAEDSAGTRRKPQLPPAHAPRPAAAPPTIPLPPVPVRREPEGLALFAFDNWAVNTFVPPLLLAVVWLLGLTFLGAASQGPTICVHEFGHATAAWFSGWRATPLPWGWTPVEPVHSNTVYFGLLFLLLLLGAAGVKERKIWPVIIAVALIALQFLMTWRLPDKTKDFWMVFGGVGGEFALSTLLMLAFWVRLPDKFKWGAVRYLFFLIGAAAFLAIWQRWREIYPGREEIPFGSMINGEDDANGDMNRLMDDYGWTKFKIRRTYWLLGWWCWAALGFAWLVFALRLNQLPTWIVAKFARADAPAGNGQ